MRILALDLSLSATGWADAAGAGVLRPPKDHDRGMKRLVWIRDQVLEFAANTEQLHVGSASADLVVIEGYAFGAKNQAGVHAIGELGGIVRVALFEFGVPVVEIPPASLKLFATGKGNAPKDEVLAAAIRQLGYDGHDHNLADALWLHRMALAQYSGGKHTEAKERALAKIAWPRFATAVPA
jgi:Holliday junction resolvasome RuvABC endonuclease subunit